MTISLTGSLPTDSGPAEILEARYVLADAAAGGMKNNVWKGSARVLVAPELAD